MTFVQRKINVTLSGPTTVKVENLRVFARVEKSGGASMGIAQITIFGLSLDLMNQFATFGTRFRPQWDYSVTVEAGDDINGMSMIFAGTIFQAWADFQAMPDVPFQIVANAGGFQAVQNGDPTSFEGPTDAATMVKRLTDGAGIGFENNGVNQKINDPYFFGSPRNQIKEIADALGFNWVIDDNVCAIWPRGKPRGSGTLDINRDTGMVSYPTFTDYGILVKTEFSRPIPYGAQFNVTSDLTPACGTWYVSLLDYDLQAREPHGHWFVSLGGVRDAGAILKP